MFRIFTLVTTVFLLSLSPLESAGQGARLIWDANTESNIGYAIYYDISPPGDHTPKIYLGNVTECELSSLYLMEATDYHLALTAYYTPTPKNESSFSEEIFFDPDDEINFSEDNCPHIYNPDQKDTFPPGGNGIGDACECEGDFNCDGAVSSEDLGNLLEDFASRSIHYNECTNNNPCYGDFDCDGNVDVDDMKKFIEDFGRSQYNLNTICPACEVGNWCDYD